MAQFPGKKILSVFFFILIVLVTSAFITFSDNGFLHLLKMKQELWSIEAHNEQLQRENFDLFKRVKAFSQNGEYQERAIRSELGWIKEGEIVIDFIRPPQKD